MTAILDLETVDRLVEIARAGEAIAPLKSDDGREWYFVCTADFRDPRDLLWVPGWTLETVTFDQGRRWFFNPVRIEDLPSCNAVAPVVESSSAREPNE